MTTTDPSQKVTAPRPKVQDAKGEILEHAKRLFRQKGFSAVSMNDLVEAVKLTKPTIYYHFTDKENLFAEVAIEMMRHGNERFMAGIKRCKNTREKLTRLAEGYFRFSPTSLNTLVRDASEHLNETHLKRVMEAHRFYLLQPLSGVFEEGIANGEINAQENPERLAFFFMSWIDAMTTLTVAHQGRSFDTKDCATQMIGIFMDGVSVTAPAGQDPDAFHPAPLPPAPLNVDPEPLP